MFSDIVTRVGKTLNIGQKNFNCPTCGMNFSNRIKLNVHKGDVHPEIAKASWEHVAKMTRS